MPIFGDEIQYRDLEVIGKFAVISASLKRRTKNEPDRCLVATVYNRLNTQTD